MDSDRWLATATNMIDYGGGFAQQLGKLIVKADSGNRERIEKAFPDYLERYKPENWQLPPGMQG